MSLLIENNLAIFPLKTQSFSENDLARSKLLQAQTKYSELQSAYNFLKEQLFSNEITIKSLNTQISALKQSLNKQDLYHGKMVEYLHQQLKLQVKSQKVWIDYLKRENQFLKNRMKSKNSDTLMKQSELLKIQKNPINMLIWKMEQMASQQLTQDSKFKKLLIPFFSALYKSKTTEQLFQQCIQLFRNCSEYETALTKGQKITSIIDQFSRQVLILLKDDDEQLDIYYA